MSTMETETAWDLFSLRIFLEIRNKGCVCLKSTVLSTDSEFFFQINLGWFINWYQNLTKLVVSNSLNWPCYKIEVAPSGFGWVLSCYFEFNRALISRWKTWRCQTCPAACHEPLANLQECTGELGLLLHRRTSSGGICPFSPKRGALVLSHRIMCECVSAKGWKAGLGSEHSGRRVTAAVEDFYPVVSWECFHLCYYVYYY